MNIRNIALVRATNVIPLDGIVYPISEVPYLHKEKGTEFSFAMYDLLNAKGMLKQVDWSKLDEMDEVDKENKKILNQYVPYNSDYNSMVLWSLNGLVPDDMNNTFSNKTCAIIEGLEEQIEEAEIISLVPTDTSIRGAVNLSSHASILISKERYESLSQEEKDKLSKLSLNITIFEGDLKEAVDKELLREGRYTAEDLSLRREDDGYLKSDTSDDVRKTVRDIANGRNIAQVLHWNVITGQNDEPDKLENVKDEFENILIVSDFYKKAFFEYLFSKMDIDSGLKGKILNLPESSVYMKALCGEIDRIGIDKYKILLDEYNNSLEALRKAGNLPTPQEIVNAKRENKKINLVSMIGKVHNEHEAQGNSNSTFFNVLEITKKTTRIDSMNEEIENIKRLAKGKDDKSQEIN